MAIDPIDTSALGPVRLDPNAVAERARLVREALEALAGEAYAAGEPREGAMFDALAMLGSDAALAKLGRLLK